MADDSIQDWSLQAIVRGSSGDYTKIVDHTMDIDESFFDVFGSHHQQLDGEFFESLSNGYIDELQEFYKPFYRVDPPNSIPSKTSVELHDGVKNSVEVDKDHQTDLSSGTICVAKDKPAAYTPKYKRRKNQQKRVVTQVSAEGLASDLWAWRKYGQKPIKGSPYPRSYYRCSSSKGCLARKQVEQSCIDPGKFIITYSAEHNHSQPTRRNSLAGTVRQKFPSPKSLKTHVKQENWEDDSSIITSAGPHEKQEQVKKEEQRKMHDEINEFLMSDFVFEGDLFSGLEGFDEFESEVPTNYSSSSQQFPVRSCS